VPLSPLLPRPPVATSAWSRPPSRGRRSDAARPVRRLAAAWPPPPPGLRLRLSTAADWLPPGLRLAAAWPPTPTGCRLVAAAATAAAIAWPSSGSHLAAAAA